MVALQSYVLTVSAYVFKSGALVLLVYPGKYPYLCELKNSLFLCWQWFVNSLFTVLVASVAYFVFYTLENWKLTNSFSDES